MSSNIFIKEEWINSLPDNLRKIAQEGMSNSDFLEEIKLATDNFGTKKVPKKWKFASISILSYYFSWLQKNLVSNAKHLLILENLFVTCSLCGLVVFRTELAHVFTANIAICRSCNREAKKREKEKLKLIYNELERDENNEL